jgi:hypothetical protein
MEVRFKNFAFIRGSYTQQGLSNHITFRPIKSGATVPLSSQKRTPAFKNMQFLNFSTFVGHFCPSGSTDLIKTESNPDPKPSFRRHLRLLFRV